MKAAYIEQTGSVQNIIVGNLPKPKPAENEVLVKVAAVSVNPVDTYLRSGMIAMELPMPYILGSDLAGVVEAVGPAVTKFQVGDRVWGSNQGMMGRQGTSAQYAAVEEQWLYPTPDEVSDQDAAAIALVGITAHLGLFHKAGLAMGETVFVNGGTGGVGSCVVQMAKAIGARVIATAGTDEKVKACRELGATAAFNYKTSDVDAAIRRYCPNGVDIWFETRREQNLGQVMEHLNLGGRLILIAGRESQPPLPVGPFYTKDCTIYGYAMFNSPAEQQRKCAAEINRWMARGKLRANIDRVMPLSEAAAAHKLQEDSTLKHKGKLAGKIVLKV